MQLTYRGQTYNKSMPATEASVLAEEGLFLGARFKRKRSYTRRPQQPPVQLVYRGAKYTR